jgi:hypothetical protein
MRAKRGRIIDGWTSGQAALPSRSFYPKLRRRSTEMVFTMLSQAIGEDDGCGVSEISGAGGMQFVVGADPHSHEHNVKHSFQMID